MESKILSKVKISFKVLAFSLLISTSNIYAANPNWAWVKHGGGTSSQENGNGVATDANGNVYVTGRLSSLATFGSTTLSPVGGGDIYVVKYNPIGNVLWAVKGGSTYIDNGYGIAVDGNNDVYVTGGIGNSSVTFGDSTHSSNGNADVVLVKLFSATGNVAWLKTYGGTGSEQGNAIAIDASNNVYVTGYTNSPTITCNNILTYSSTNNHFFVLKVNSSGTNQWIKGMYNAESGIGNGICVDKASGYIYATGSFSSSTITFGTTSLSNTGGGIFTVKYDATGADIWSRKGIGSSGSLNIPYAITSDASGNIYCTGYTSSPTITFGSLSATSADGSVFFIKYNSSGTEQFVKRFGVATSAYGFGVTTYGSNAVYITGYFDGATAFTVGSTSYTTIGGGDIFVSKFDASGTHQWTNRAGGTGYDIGQGIASTPDGNVVLTGYVTGASVAFDTTTVATNNGSQDMFVAKLYSDYNNPPKLNALNDINLCSTSTDVSHSVALSGIGTGGETQTLTISAISANTIPVVIDSVHYTSPQTTGTLYYHQQANQSSSSQITVTVTDGIIPINSVSRTFNVNITTSPTLANAGIDQTICLTANLGASIPSFGTGAWSKISGSGGSFSNTSSYNSSFTGTAGVTYVLRWTTTNLTCSSYDDVIITVKGNPTTANAGPNQTICGTGATLTANTASTGSGVWSIESGGAGNFSSASNPTTTFTGTAGNTYVLRWTINNSPCTASVDDVTIAFVQTPTVADAGPNQTLCGVTSATLAANAPAVGAGTWTIQSGTGGSFANANLAGTTFTGTAGNTYSLRWTISNAPCASNYDDVTIIFNQNPTTANAGTDQLNLCGLTIANISANVPAIGVGSWSIVSGGAGTFGNTSSAATNFTGAAGSTYTLRWTINNATCVASTNSVVIAFPRIPTQAYAGVDTTICNTATILLHANTPNASYGETGTWSGSCLFSNSNSNTSTAYNFVSNAVNKLVWTISNGTPCPVSRDTVKITTNNAACASTVANFSANKTIACINDAIVFSDLSSQATSWTWNFGIGATPPTATGAGPHSVTYSTSGQKTISLTISGPGGTDAEIKNNYIEIKTLPSAAGTVSGSPNVCQGNNSVLYIVPSISNADTYVWALPTGVTNSGSVVNSISVDFGLNAQSGTISVYGQNLCGIGASSNYAVTVNPRPQTPGTITAPALICNGNTGVIFTIPSITNANTYRWILSNGLTSSSLNNETSVPYISVDLTSGITSGSVRVYGHSNICGDGDTSAAYTFIVNPYPVAAGTINGVTSPAACANQNGILYSVSPITNALVYTWTVPTGATIVAGNFSNSITLNYGVNASSGNITVSGVNGCGSGAASNLPVNFTSVPTATLCYVTVDSSNGAHNILYWQKPTQTYVDSFIIYKDIAGLGFNRIDAVSAGTSGSYIDVASSPNVKPESYKIASKDSCGNESAAAGTYHKTILLGASVNLAGTVVYLSWSDYVGVNDPLRYYRILRANDAASPFLTIDSVPATTLAYNDSVNTLFPNAIYAIDLVWSSNCVPSARTLASVSTTRSNIKNRALINSIHAFENKQTVVNIFPNPSKNTVNIELHGSDKNYILHLVDVLGRTVAEKQVNNFANFKSQTQLSLTNLNRGIYMLVIESESGKQTRKLVVE